MRRADAAVGTGGRQIGVDRVAGQITVWEYVRAGGDGTGVLRIGRTGERVGAHVVIDLGLAGHQAAVPFDAGFHLDDGAEAAAGEKHFVAGKYPARGAARFARQQRD